MTRPRFDSIFIFGFDIENGKKKDDSIELTLSFASFIICYFYLSEIFYLSSKAIHWVLLFH